jgi:ATP-dependent Clp protease ATP-binding subunit ClpX
MNTELTPEVIAAALGRRVLGQDEAVREMSVALFKKLTGLSSGNILMIGSSGTGKTTLMRSVEDYLAGDPELADSSTVVRIHAKVLAEESDQSRAGEGVLRRLFARAKEALGDETDPQVILRRAERGIVFVDEVDKIRSHVGGDTHVDGIRAQEALLTLIENEAVPLPMPEWAGGGVATVNSSGLLFVCGGAFEGLYDGVLDRVTVGRDRGALQPVTVVSDGTVEEQTLFTLAEWLELEDLFDYGMSPQFLSRFDARIVLNDLGEDELVKIFLENDDSSLKQSEAFFDSRGIRLAISPAAVRRIAVEARSQPRLGARALKEIFRRVVRRFEFEPESHTINGALMIDLPEVEEALAHDAAS